MTKTSFQAFSKVASRWLVWQCKMISDVKVGAVFVHKNNPEDGLEMLASWPDSGFESMVPKLHELAEDVIADQDSKISKVTCSLTAEETVCDVTALPLRYGNETVGAVVFLQSIRSLAQKEAVSQLFQWGTAWLEVTLAAAYEEQNQLQPLVTSLSKLALKDAPLAVTGHEICNLLSQQLDCKRVSFGIVNGLQVHTVALSNQLRFDPRASSVREMETAMEEAVDQKQSVIYPQVDETNSLVTHKHAHLSSLHEDSSVLSIVISREDKLVGSILMLRSSNKPFTKQEVKILEYAVELLGPILALKLKEEDSIGTKLSQATKKRLVPLFGSEKFALKISTLGLFILLSLLSLIKTEDYVYAKSSLEGATQRVIVAPQDGFIKSADVRAGDSVESNQTLVRLDDYDLKLEHEKLLSERNKITKEYQETLALRQRAKMSILLAQISQVEAKLDLVVERLNRVRLEAPFSGIVVSGDLSHSLGAPVKKGEQLFEIAPFGDYRVKLNIDDHDISKLQVGQSGNLRLVGLPYEQLHITISKITPVASAQQGGNYFRVEATILKADKTRLRPGMQGVTKIEVAKESVLWVWTHTLFERIRLWLWSIGL